MTATSDLVAALRRAQDAEAKLERVAELHTRGGIVAKGYPKGWCEHDQHPWPCPTQKRLEDRA